MPQISKIKYSDVLEARRYDAEYFKPEYLKDDNALEKIGYYNLSSISNVKWWKRLPLWEDFSPEWVPYIRAEDIKNSFVQYENVPRISEDLHKKLFAYQTKKEDVLLTIVWNSVWDVWIVKFKLDKCNLTENASKITKLKEINSDALFAYMLSKYGQNQIHREKVWTAQPKLALDRIRKFKIPKLSEKFQNDISNLVKLSNQKQTQSKQLYNEAEELILQELGLLDYTPKHSLTFSITKKEINEAKRYDAEYFQPKYYDIIEKIENYKWGFDAVWNIFKRKKGIEVGSEAYTDDWKGFVRVSDFTINGVESVSKKISENYFEEIKKNYQPKKWEILFTKDGTIGISYVLKEEVEWILSWAFLRLTLKENYKDYEKECLALILNSVMCKLQVEQLSWGALIAHLKPSDFEKFKIPLIKPEIQSQIAQKIQESHRLRKESKELLEEAKRNVEYEIENNY